MRKISSTITLVYIGATLRVTWIRGRGNGEDFEPFSIPAQISSCRQKGYTPNLVVCLTLDGSLFLMGQMHTSGDGSFF